MFKLNVGDCPFTIYQRITERLFILEKNLNSTQKQLLYKVLQDYHLLSVLKMNVEFSNLSLPEFNLSLEKEAVSPCIQFKHTVILITYLFVKKDKKT